MCAQALQVIPYDITIFKEFRQLCGRAGLLPTSHIIPGKLIHTTERPVAHGGFGDVREASGKVVATYERQVFHGDPPCQLRALRATFASRSRHLASRSALLRTSRRFRALSAL